MSDDIKSSYGYDPLAKAGRDRWGKKGEDRFALPDLLNYDFLDVLGAGAMGVVWSTRYKPLNQARAVKVLSQAMAIDATFLERFAEEAKVLARLEHPNIVKVYDASADPTCPYIAMDFVAGKTLNEVMKNQGLSQDEMLKYFRQIAEALDYAHGMGFVHRDVKPSNIMITNAGNALLIDFGVASWLGGDKEGAKTVIGTIRYMSPEACKGERVTKASDLWAFAVLMYRTLTGSFPFDGNTEQEIIRSIVNDSANEPNYPNRRVRAFLRNAFPKEPKERPTSAVAMVQDLRRAIKPLIFRARREHVALGASVGIAGLIIFAMIGGIAWYLAPNKKPRKEVVYKIQEVAVPQLTPRGGSGGGPTATGPIADIQNLRGVWYANFGNQWAEIHLAPGTGAKFHAIIAERDQAGSVTVEADGSALPDNKIKYDESTIDGNSNEKTAVLGSFMGQLSEDHSRITGKRTEPGGQPSDGTWVRATDISTTPYVNSQLQFSVPVPVGWLTTSGDTTTFSPIGRPDVMLSVKIANANGAQTVQDVFQAREKELTESPSSGGSYENLGVNASATLGGRQAVSWELHHQLAGGALMHSIIVGVLQGDTCATVESWWPNSEEDVWSPILESMRKKFAFTN